MKRIFIFLPFLVVALISFFAFTKQNQQTYKDDYWLKKCDDVSMNSPCSYVDRSGKVRIRKGKYPICYTDTFRTMAIVYDTAQGCIGINKNCQKLFNVFWFDNGPDYVSEDLFRITDRPNAFTQKVGFANLKGEIVIPQRFDFAEPFSDGLAAFCVGDTLKWDKTHEYIGIHGGKWGYINKKGEVVIPAKYDSYSFSNGEATMKLNNKIYTFDKTGKLLKTE